MMIEDNQISINRILTRQRTHCVTFYACFVVFLKYNLNAVLKYSELIRSERFVEFFIRENLTAFLFLALNIVESICMSTQY